MIRVLIVADERFARDKIRILLASHRDFEVIAESADAQDGLRKIQALAPDAMFLDLQMPRVDGIDMLAQIPGAKPYTVVTAADTDHAVRAFELGVLDYLLKPFDATRFDATLTRIRRHVERDFRAAGRFDMDLMLNRSPAAPLSAPAPAGIPAPLQTNPERVPVKRGRRVMFLDAANMRCIYADRDYVNVHMTTGEVIHTSDRMSHMEEKLSRLPFLRVHRSVIVNLNQVREVNRAGNAYDFVLSGKVRVLSGCTYKRDINALVTSWKRAGDKRVNY
jgi:two-component system LytT family response regulator